MMQMWAACRALVGSALKVTARQDLSCIVVSKMCSGHVLHKLAAFRAVMMQEITDVDVSM